MSESSLFRAGLWVKKATPKRCVCVPEGDPHPGKAGTSGEEEGVGLQVPSLPPARGGGLNWLNQSLDLHDRRPDRVSARVNTARNWAGGWWNPPSFGNRREAALPASDASPAPFLAFLGGSGGPSTTNGGQVPPLRPVLSSSAPGQGRAAKGPHPQTGRGPLFCPHTLPRCRSLAYLAGLAAAEGELAAGVGSGRGGEGEAPLPRQGTRREGAERRQLAAAGG